jgi:hypothetical protein
MTPEMLSRMRAQVEAAIVGVDRIGPFSSDDVAAAVRAVDARSEASSFFFRRKRSKNLSLLFLKKEPRNGAKAFWNFFSRKGVAEGVGFEPTDPCGSPVFGTGAISQALPPLRRGLERGAGVEPASPAWKAGAPPISQPRRDPRTWRRAGAATGPESPSTSVCCKRDSDARHPIDSHKYVQSVLVARHGSVVLQGDGLRRRRSPAADPGPVAARMNAVSTATAFAFVPVSLPTQFHLPLHQLQLFSGWPPVWIEPRPVAAPRPVKPRPAFALRADTLHLLDDWMPRIVVKKSPARPRAATPPLDEDGLPRSEALRKLLQVLRQLARSSAEVPENPDLARRIGVLRQTAARGVRQLEQGGLFVMEVRANSRRIVFPDGTATDWGTFRKGHAPGTPRRSAPASEPPPAAMRSLPAPPRPAAAPLDLRRAAETCQFPTWPHDAPPPRQNPERHICGAPTVPGESWCAAHLAIVSPGRAKRRERLLGSTSLCCM